MAPKITVTRYLNDRTVASVVLNPDDPETVHSNGKPHTQKTITKAPLRETTFTTTEKSNWVKAHEARRKVIDPNSQKPLLWCPECHNNWQEREFVFDDASYSGLDDAQIESLVTGLLEQS